MSSECAVDYLSLSDRLIGEDKGIFDKDCVSEARVIGLTFSVGRLLRSITQTMHVAAESSSDSSDLHARLLLVLNNWGRQSRQKRNPLR